MISTLGNCLISTYVPCCITRVHIKICSDTLREESFLQICWFFFLFTTLILFTAWFFFNLIYFMLIVTTIWLKPDFHLRYRIDSICDLCDNPATRFCNSCQTSLSLDCVGKHLHELIVPISHLLFSSFPTQRDTISECRFCENENRFKATP